MPRPNCTLLALLFGWAEDGLKVAFFVSIEGDDNAQLRSPLFYSLALHPERIAGAVVTGQFGHSP